MAINLLSLVAKFRDIADIETQDAYFRTKVPAAAPNAYLNIVYKPSAGSALKEIDNEINFPSTLRDFYRQWNGARFFIGALAVNGCLPVGQQIDRSDPFRLLPFDTREENREFQRQRSERDLVCIGSYSFDGSIVCMRRDSQAVVCHMGQQFSKVRREWVSLEEWLNDELTRLCLLFDEEGNRLVDKAHLLPGSESSRVV